MEMLLEKANEKRRRREALHSQQFSEERKEKNYFQFVFLTTPGHHDHGKISPSQKNKRKVFKNNYFRKYSQKNINYLKKRQQATAFNTLLDSVQKKPIKKIHDCLSIRNINLYSDMKFGENKRLKFFPSSREKEEVDVENGYLKSKMICGKVSGRKTQRMFVRQKQKCVKKEKKINYLISYKYLKKERTAKTTAESSPFSMIID